VCVGLGERDVVVIDRFRREREGYEEITRPGEEGETRRVRGMTWTKVICLISYHSLLRRTVHVHVIVVE
jgi:hypothetical protein